MHWTLIYRGGPLLFCKNIEWVVQSTRRVPSIEPLHWRMIACLCVVYLCKVYVTQIRRVGSPAPLLSLSQALYISPSRESWIRVRNTSSRREQLERWSPRAKGWQSSWYLIKRIFDVLRCSTGQQKLTGMFSWIQLRIQSLARILNCRVWL